MSLMFKRFYFNTKEFTNRLLHKRVKSDWDQ